MGIKSLFWKSDDGEENLSSEEMPQQLQTPPRRLAPTPATNSLLALKQGPSASIFTKTTGLGTVVASVAQPKQTALVDAEFDSAITEQMNADAKIAGLKEFMAQFNVLFPIIRDKAQSAKAALAAVGAGNKLDPKAIAQSFGERLQLLSGYEASYEADCRQSQEGEAEAKKDALSEIQTRMSEIDSEIARLASERAACEQQKGNLEVDLAGIGQKYESSLGRFHATVAAKRAELMEMISIIAPGTGEKG